VMWFSFGFTGVSAIARSLRHSMPQGMAYGPGNRASVLPIRR
jgi:hypothetical protein